MIIGLQVRGAEQRNEGIQILRHLISNETDAGLQKEYKVSNPKS